MRSLDPSQRSQTKTALPFASTATCGYSADWYGAERVSVELRVPAAERDRVWIRRNVPSELCQTNTALPLESTATWGKEAFRPEGESDWIGLRMPATERERVWIRGQGPPPQLVVPSRRCHTKTLLPLAAAATPGYSTGPVPVDNEPSGCQAASARAGNAETKATVHTKIGAKCHPCARVVLPPFLNPTTYPPPAAGAT